MLLSSPEPVPAQLARWALRASQIFGKHALRAGQFPADEIARWALRAAQVFGGRALRAGQVFGGHALRAGQFLWLPSAGLDRGLGVRFMASMGEYKVTCVKVRQALKLASAKRPRDPRKSEKHANDPEGGKIWYEPILD